MRAMNSKIFRFGILLLVLLILGIIRLNQILNPHLNLASQERTITIVLYSDLEDQVQLGKALRPFFVSKVVASAPRSLKFSKRSSKGTLERALNLKSVW
jgi:hypothetical protein